ncbi:9496_t:CDS:2 [Paraglomus occultum]|uniref:9496_t:CDS:1 n=1 Tax=Paraglomus occultum TaxID=144539 RepID=A0A9N9BMB6_9GLOM|nr:9496_t:CDS:2 [Paraglomus occultum]
MPRGNKRASAINSSPRGRPRGRGGRSRGRGRGAWSASPVYDNKSIARPISVDNEEEEKRKRRLLRFKEDRWRASAGSSPPDSNRPAFAMSSNRRPVPKYPAADRFLRDFFTASVFDTNGTDVAKIRTLPRYINIPKSGPRHRAHDFFIDLPYLQRLSDYGDAEFIMKAELQAQQAELSEIMKFKGPRVEISAEGSPIPVHARLARPLPIRTDSDIEMADAGPLTESPTTVSASAVFPEISLKKANAYSIVDGIREDLSPMDVDEDYLGSLLRSSARARRTSLNANTNTRRPSRRVSFTGTQELIDRGGRTKETMDSPLSEYPRILQFEAEVITEEPEDVDDHEAVPGTPGVNSSRSISLDGSSKATSPKLPKQKREIIPDSLNPMVFNMRTRTYASWATNSCALSDCPFHAHKQPKWVHDMLVNPPTFYF